MTIKKVKGGYRIKHCKSGLRGYIKATPKPVSEEKAHEIHAAIMAKQPKKKKKKE